MKNIIKPALVLSIAFFLLSCNEKQKNVINVGTILPLTGNIAYFGDYEQKALKVAELLYNHPDSAIQYKFINEDSQNDPKTALMAFNKLTSLNKVDVIITQMSGVSMSLAAEANRQKTPLISLAMHPDFAKTSAYSYRIYESISQESEAMSKYLIENKHNKIAIVIIDDVWGEEAMKSFKNSYEKDGVIVYSEKINNNNNDFKTVIEKIMKSKPDGVFLAAYGPIVNKFSKQFREINKDIKLFGNIGMSWSNVINNGKEWLNDAIVVMPTFVAEEQKQLPFVKKYYELFNEYPNFESSYTFDIFLFIHKAAKSRMDMNENLNTSLSKITNFNGINGKIILNNTRDALTDSIAIRKIVNGQLITIKKYGF